MLHSVLKRNSLIKLIQNVQRNLSQTTVAATANRKQSSSSNNNELTKITIDPQTKIATLAMNRLPVNAMSYELLTAIRNAVHELEREKVNGIILTSASERIFSAGLDLSKVYKPDIERLKELWISLQDMWKAFFTTPIPTAALINGHALAGGCMITTACDYRVALPNLTIGMNETRAGVAVPKWVMDSYLNVVQSRRVAEADLIAGNCYKSEEALKVGLVDAVVETREKAFEKCFEFLREFEGPTRLAKAQTKLLFRADILRDFERHRQEDLDLFVKGILRPEMQEFVANYLKSLKEKSAKK